MKTVCGLLFAWGFILLTAVCSHAALFSDTFNFSGTGIYENRDYLELNGSGSSFVYVFTHNVTFSPPADSINSAQLTLSHHDNSNNNGEVWFLYNGTTTQIGQLEISTGPGWLDQVFVLPGSLYDQISGGSWSIALKLQENTSGTDKLRLDQSVLSGVYTPVPIPPVAFLFGSGLSGLFFLRRKR